MNIFNKLRKSDASNRINEEIFYAQALREIESGLRRDGLWAQALSESGMDQSKAAAKYIKLRAQSLKDENDLAIFANQEKQKIEAKAMEEERDRDAPRHPGCGGVIDRSQIGSLINWKCRKCKKIGSFKISN